MPSQYYIPPSFENIIWPGNQDISDSNNYNKYLYNDSGNLIWKSISSFSMDSFIASMRVWYKFHNVATYTSLNTGTGAFTQILDASPNGRHTISKNAFVYTASELNCPFGGLKGSSNLSFLRVPTTIVPAVTVPYFMVFVFHFNGAVTSPIFYSLNGSQQYIRVNNNFGYDARMRNIGNFMTATGETVNAYSNKFVVMILENTGTGSKLWINGHNVLTDTGEIVQNFGAKDVTLFNLDYDTASWTWGMPNMVVDEFFVLEGSASCTVQNRQKIEGLYSHRHGANANLKNDHPYKSVSV
jgi:hypothetical protein